MVPNVPTMASVLTPKAGVFASVMAFTVAPIAMKLRAQMICNGGPCSIVDNSYVVSLHATVRELNLNIVF